MIEKIAIVDDNPYPRSIILNFLKKKGMTEIKEFSSVNDITDEGFVFLELDFDSCMNGKRAIEYIRNNPSKKFVVTAFHGEEHLIEKALDYGAIYFLMKPIKEDDIKSIFEKYLS